MSIRHQNYTVGLLFILACFGITLSIFGERADARGIRGQYKGKHFGIGSVPHSLSADCPASTGSHSETCYSTSTFAAYICPSETGCIGTGWEQVSGGGARVATEHTVKFYTENVADGELYETLMHFNSDATATIIHCQCRGGGTMEAFWKIDGVLVLDTTPGSIVCDAEEEDITLTGDDTFAAGQDLDLLIDNKSGTITSCTFQLTYQYD